MEEAREDDRAAVTLRVGYTRLNTFFADYTKNISRGGTFIRTAQPLELGTEFIFELTVPRADSDDLPDDAPVDTKRELKIKLTGTVKWIVSEAEATPDKPAGMGIQFVFKDDTERDRVQAMVTDLMKASLGEHLAHKLLNRK
jgi:type IV pilus assembly protein PilZ